MSDSIKLRPIDRKVLALLLRGKSRTHVADKLGKSRSTIRGIADKLESNGIIARIPGSTNPVSYCDPAQLIVGRESATPNGGYVAPGPPKGTHSDNELRAHLHGYYRVPVIKIGTFDYILDPRGNKMRLFHQESPTLDHNQCKEWHASIYVNHEWISIAYWQSPRDSFLKVYPKENWCEPNSLEKAKEMFEQKVLAVVEVIKTYAGWELGEPFLKGRIFYAITDPDITQHFEDVEGVPKIPGQELDASTGQLEYEMDDIERAKYMALSGQYIKAHEKSLTQIRAELREMRYAVADLVDITQGLIRAGTNQAKVNLEFMKMQPPFDSFDSPGGYA